MLLLLWLFGAYATQQRLVGIANEYDISSGTYLLCVLVLAAVPIAVLAWLVKMMREMVARKWDKQGLRYQLWRVWLWAYVLAFGLCVYLIQMMGVMMVRHLE